MRVRVLVKWRAGLDGGLCGQGMVSCEGGVWAAEFKLRLTFRLPVSARCSLDTCLEFVAM